MHLRQRLREVPVALVGDDHRLAGLGDQHVGAGDPDLGLEILAPQLAARLQQQLVEALEVPAGAGVVDVYRVGVDATGSPTASRIVEVPAPFLPPGYSRASADALAASVASGSEKAAWVPAPPRSRCTPSAS